MKDKRFLFTVVIFNFCIIAFVFYQTWPRLFYDLLTFFEGSADELLGLNPYRQKELSFVYHPAVLEFNLYLERFKAVSIFYIFAIIVSTILLALAFKNYLKFSNNYHLSIFNILFLLFCNAFIFAELLVKMNVSVLLNNIILSIILYDLSASKRKNYVAFIGIFCVLLCSTIKPYLLAYFFYFFMSRRGLTFKFAVVLIPLFILAFFPLSKLFFPEKFPLFLQALERQTLSRGDGLLDVGFSYFGFLTRVFSSKFALFGHFIVVLILTLLFLLSRNLKLDLEISVKPSSIFLLILIIITTNPRMMIYDFFYIYLFIPLVIRLEAKGILILVVFASLLLTYGKYVDSNWAGLVQKVVWWLPVLVTLVYIDFKETKFCNRLFSRL